MSFEFKLSGPFAIRQGPKTRIICIWCEKHVALRSGRPGEIFALMCTRPVCEGERPTNHPWNGIEP